MDKQDYEAKLLAAYQKNDDIGWRLQLAQQFGQLMTKAYDALLHHGVNYKALRTWPLWERLLPNGATFDNPAARSKIIGWITQVAHDIDAAVRRKKNIKEVDLGPRSGVEDLEL